MRYVNGEEKYGDSEFFIVKNGDSDPNINNTQLSYTINKYISILDLVDTEIPTTVVDLNGVYYKVRLATHQGASDQVYQNWFDRKFTKTENKLVDDLNLIDMLNYKYSGMDQSLISKEVADFLYYITYYKCFKDVSILTRRECMLTRSVLQELYKYNLTLKSRKTQGIKREGVSVRCSAINIRSESIVCDIKFSIADDKIITSKILDGNVTYAKIQAVNSGSILGRTTAGSGAGAHSTSEGPMRHAARIRDRSGKDTRVWRVSPLRIG